MKNIVAMEQNAWTIGAGNFGEVRLGQDLLAETRSKVVQFLKIGWVVNTSHGDHPQGCGENGGEEQVEEPASLE